MAVPHLPDPWVYQLFREETGGRESNQGKVLRPMSGVFRDAGLAWAWGRKWDRGKQTSSPSPLEETQKAGHRKTGPVQGRPRP